MIIARTCTAENDALMMRAYAPMRLTHACSHAGGPGLWSKLPHVLLPPAMQVRKQTHAMPLLFYPLTHLSSPLDVASSPFPHARLRLPSIKLTQALISSLAKRLLVEFTLLATKAENLWFALLLPLGAATNANGVGVLVILLRVVF